jgi:predicted CopG family antitoxin
MTHKLTITVDDAVYRMLKPMVEAQTVSVFLQDFLNANLKNVNERSVPDIKALRGTLGKTDTADIREEEDRTL